MVAVSIVVPTYRRPHFLRSALASALAQTYADLEILVCDNAADEDTRALVDGFADTRIRYIGRPADLGMMRNAVLGFEAARGDHVLKLDDDDLLCPRAVERLLAPLTADPGLTLSFARFWLVDVHGERLAAQTAANEAHCGRDLLAAGLQRPFTRLVARGAVGLTCALVRRDAIEWARIPEDVQTAYDRHIALSAAAGGRGAWFVDDHLAAYRLHEAADSRRALTRQALGSLRAMERALASGAHRRGDLAPATRDGALLTARLLLREGRAVEARAVLRRALVRGPDVQLGRLALLACLPAPVATRLARTRQRRHERGAERPQPRVRM